MNKNLRIKIFIILVVLAASLYFALPLDKRINLGLDLKGGMHLVLKVDTEKLSDNAKADAVLRAIEILRNRIDGLGVGETSIQRQGEDEIIVQLPGITDREKALAMIGRVAQLEFRLVNSDPTQLRAALAGQVPDGYILKYIKKETETPAVLVENTVALGGDTIADARVDFESTGFGLPYISLKFNADGAKKFGELTQNNVGRRLAIIMDGEVLSAPNIKEAILGGSAQITGQFSMEEASLLSLALRSGSLPAPMHIEEERTIGPLLGRDSINDGIKACVIGASFVFIFMLFYYLLPGLIANIGLVLNLIMIVGLMGFLKIMLPDSQMTLTLPGIAGIILTLGMAVDANVLINERIREEIKNGRPLQAAISSGFDKAFNAIFDSHVTNLIAAFILFQFGSGPIKGFAVTLSIGLLASLFTAITVTKTFLQLLVNLRLVKSLPMVEFFHKPNFNFFSKRYIAFFFSAIIVFASIFALVKKGNQIYGIDFAGGQIQEYRFSKPVKAETLREYLKEIHHEDAIIQQLDKKPEDVIIRTAKNTYNDVSNLFKTKMPDNHFDVLRIEEVGPVVGKALRTRAILAIVLALGGILIYCAFRFKDFDFAAAGVIALLYDVFVALGMTVILGRQVDLLVVTALLTIAGYSINDTIIVYDRVRENRARLRKSSLTEVINESLNQTLSRTILTTLVTLLVVLALYLFGGKVLNSFALCLMIGFASGAYSTIYIVSPLVIAWQKKSKR